MYPMWSVKATDNADYISTGCLSEIWKKIQVKIYFIYIASTETNNTQEESSGILYDTLKKL